MTRFLSLALLLYFISITHAQPDPQFQDIEIPFTQPAVVTSSQTKYYRINISDRQPGLDLSLLAINFRGPSARLYASKSQDEIKQPETVKYSSKSDTGDIVYIPSDDLLNEQAIYVALVCTSPECNMQLGFEYSKEIKVAADGLNHYVQSHSLTGATMAVVRLHVPEKAQAERIVIHAEAIPSKNQVEIPAFDVLINQGQDIPHTSRVSNIARTAWFEGKTIVIHQDNSLFCENCDYTLSMKVAEHTSINIQANIFGSDIDLTGHHVLDGVLGSKSNSYKFTLQDADKDIVIQIRPQQGQLKVLIDCGDDIPDDLSRYYWQYYINSEREIVMTDKEHARCKNNKVYYIVVSGYEDSVYSIRAVPREASNLMLKTDSNIVGDIFPGETISYEVFMPLFAIEEFMVTLEPDNALGFDVIPCRFSTDCPGLLPASDQTNPIQQAFDKNETVFEVDRIDLGGFKKRIQINPHKSGCYPILIQHRRFMHDAIPVCAYKFTLNSTQDSPVEYTLKPVSKAHDWMYPGVQTMDSVSNQQSKYFMVYVPQTNAKSVIIQVTKFSGDVEVFVSRTEKFPDTDTDDTQFSHEGMIVYNNTGTGLNGTYYITVKGTQTSSFSIASFIIAEDGERLDYALSLQEGVPQKGVLVPKHEHPVRYFKFQLDLKDDWEGSVKILLRPTRGKLIMVVNNDDSIPMPSMSNWRVKSHELEITSSESLFKRNGTYHIGVYMDWGDENALVLEDITFNIMYYVQEKEEEGQISNKNHLILSALMPYHGKVKKGETKFFKISIANEDSGLTIYKQADAGGVEMFLSTNQENQYPDSQEYDQTTLNTHANYISLEKYEIAKICDMTGNGMLCNLYLSVVPASDQETTSFSLIVKRDFRMSDELSITPLEDGKQQIHNVPEDEKKPVFFYFYGNPSQDSVVSVTCPGKRITIYALEKAVTIGESVHPEIETPSPESYSISTKESESNSIGLAHLTIEPHINSNSTIISLAVYFSNASNSDDSFTIVVNSQATHIYTGQPYYGAVATDSYVYFNFDVSREDCILLISLTTLNDGNPDLVVSFGEDAKPTVKNASFTSISDQRTELIEISKADVSPRTSMVGTWVVGVYGRTASTFTLTVMYEDQKTVELQRGVPFEMFLKENSFMYFKYYHEQPNDIEIKLDTFSGDLTAYVTNIKKTEVYSSNLPNQTHYSWKMIADVESLLKIKANDSNACTNCLYVLGVETKAASKFVIHILEDSKFIKVQTGLHYSDGLEPFTSKSYVFTSINADEVVVNVHITGAELKVFTSQNALLSDTLFDQSLILTANNNIGQLLMSKANFVDEPKSNGESVVRSERNSFYFLLENPTIAEVNYTFIVTTKDSNDLLRPGARQRVRLEPKGETAWLYYSSHDNENIKIIIDFHMKKEGDLDSERESVIANGLPIQGNYWREKQTTGPGEAVFMSRNPAMNDQIGVRNSELEGDVLSYRQVISTPSKKGKFEFTVQNPFDTQVMLGIRLYRSGKGAFSMDQNSEHTSLLERGQSEHIEIYLAHKGPWYLWVYTCSGDIEVNIEDSTATSLELESSEVSLAQGQDHLYTSYNQVGGMKAVKIKAGPNAGHNTQYYLSTSHFFEDTVYDYETTNSQLTINSNYNFDPASTLLHVTIPAVEFEKYESTDEIVYSIRLCPANEQNKEEGKNVCGFDMECRSNNTRLHINTEGKFIQSWFDGVKEGSYFVKAVANVYHEDKMIKFVSFPTRKVHVGPHSFLEEGKTIIGYVLVGLAVIIAVGLLGYCGYKKMKASKKDPNLEMQNLPSKKSEYATVETEEADASRAPGVDEASIEKI